MTAETKLCGGCGQPVRLTAKACAFCKTSTDVAGREAPVQCDTMDINGGRCTLVAGHSANHVMGTATGQPKASFGRILATPLIVIIAAFLIGSLVGQVMLAVVIAAVVSIIYILAASQRQ